MFYSSAREVVARNDKKSRGLYMHKKSSVPSRSFFISRFTTRKVYNTLHPGRFCCWYTVLVFVSQPWRLLKKVSTPFQFQSVRFAAFRYFLFQLTTNCTTRSAPPKSSLRLYLETEILSIGKDVEVTDGGNGSLALKELLGSLLNVC